MRRTSRRCDGRRVPSSSPPRPQTTRGRSADRECAAALLRGDEDMTDATPEEATNELIDALRNEILHEEASTADEESIVPDGIVALVAQAEVPSEVGLAIDELLVEEDTMNGALHSRLVGRVRNDIERRASAPMYLEQILRTERER